LGEEDVFWEAGNSDIEVIVVVFLDVPNEVDSMDKASFDCLPDFFTGWRVPSKSQNIATSVVFSSLGQENTVYCPNDDRIL
jgi:hypothetical protein